MTLGEASIFKRWYKNKQTNKKTQAKKGKKQDKLDFIKIVKLLLFKTHHLKQIKWHIWGENKCSVYVSDKGLCPEYKKNS